MKNHLILLSLFCSILLQSCEDCEIINQTIEEPPELFDCPNLMVNIGATCNDQNPSTINDTVTVNCICAGEVINECSGRLLVLRSIVQNGEVGPVFLDAAEKAAVAQINFSNLENLTGPPLQTGIPFAFQFSTISPLLEQYFFSFQYNSPPENPLLVSSTDNSSAPNFSFSNRTYAAPVAHQGTIYAIDVVFDDPTAQYSILSIDQTSGQATELINGTITANSQVINPSFFSATNDGGKVFFVAGTSLFEYSVTDNSVTHVLLEPNPDPDFITLYTGLEYQSDNDRLLAIRSSNTASGINSSLVAISQDGTFTESVLMDVEGYTLFSDSGILHSTAFSQCDNIYYITSIKELDVDFIESVLIEIDVSSNSILDKIFPDFLFGIELDKD